MVPFLVAAVIVAAKAIHDSNQAQGESRQESDERPEPQRASRQTDSDGSETYRGFKLTGSGKDRETLKETIDEYCKDAHDARELRRYVKRIDANRDGRGGYSYKGNHIALGVNFGKRDRLRYLAHEIGHERRPNGGEKGAEAYEADFIERRE